MPEKSLTYSNGEITIIWKQHKCIHSGNCIRKLPMVFSPMQRPWVNIMNADTEKIKAAIDLSGPVAAHEEGVSTMPCPAGTSHFSASERLTQTVSPFR